MANPTGKGGFQPGKSGNPDGRPPNNRVLTALLEAAGAKTVQAGTKRTARKQALAQMMWEGVTEGQVTLPAGKMMELGPADWLALAKWIYGQIDGPPPQTHEHTGDGGGDIVIRVVYGDSSPTSETAPETSGDQGASR
jgi:hypothetical protein